MSSRHAIYIIHLICLHIGAMLAMIDLSSWWILVSCVAFLFLQIVGANIALHRFFSHRSFETGPHRQRFLIIAGSLTCLGSSLSWVASHRHHHRHADQFSDCHSPHHLGWHKILLGFWNNPDNVLRSLKTLPYFSWHLFLHNWYYVIHFSIMAALLAMDWHLFAYVYALPNLLVYYALYAVVIFCHKYGYRNYQTSDHSANNALVAYFSMGEGWHNNHHHNPDRYRNTVKSYEWDATARVIELFFIK